MTQQWPQQDPYQRRPVDINAYAPPKNPNGTRWVIAVAVVVVAAVLAFVFIRPNSDAPAPSPTPSAPEQTAGPGMPFSLPGATASAGRWEVLSRTWDGDAVVARVKITADRGDITYGFVMFSNAGTTVYDPTPGAPAPALDTGTLSAGQTTTGYVRFEIPRGDATLILTTKAGRQMSALPISG